MHPYSDTYRQARERFLAAALKADCALHAYPAGTDDGSLTMDIATCGPHDAPTLMVTSGLHGVEGYFGSAVQLAYLEQISRSPPDKFRVVLLHAINAFGFEHVRRFDQLNIDLNRNFLLTSESYTGEPKAYAELNTLLNPTSPPSRWEPFLLKALWQISRRGMQPIKQAVAEGQYERPQGVFFGGKRPSHAMQTIDANIETWMGSSPEVLLIDFHTGLGSFADYRLLLEDSSTSPQCTWFRDAFCPEKIEAADADTKTAYRSRGIFTAWLQQRLGPRICRAAVAEFGTYGPVRVLGAIRAENRAHFYSTPDSPAYRRAKSELLECFCPWSPEWRKRSLTSSLHLLNQGATAIRK